MKQIGIFGHWNPDDPKIVGDYEFTPLGYAHKVLPKATDWELSRWRDAFDLLIIAPFGADPPSLIEAYGQSLRGGKARLAVWSFDSHNPEAAEKEAAASRHVDVWFSAHSHCVATIGPKAIWMPCCYCWHSAKDPRWAFDLDPALAKMDVSCFARPYLQRAFWMENFKGSCSRLGLRYFIGQTDIGTAMDLYQWSKAVFNPPIYHDLNIRFFEAWAANRPIVATPAWDLNDPRFTSLKESVFLLPDELLTKWDDELVGEMVLRAIAKSPTNTRSEILRSHMLINRYEEITLKSL